MLHHSWHQGTQVVAHWPVWMDSAPGIPAFICVTVFQFALILLFCQLLVCAMKAVT
jgi:hypothetical protein